MGIGLCRSRDGITVILTLLVSLWFSVRVLLVWSVIPLGIGCKDCRVLLCVNWSRALLKHLLFGKHYPG
ncbi:hypothetical protein Goshw_027474 [Gossypium schwendimanii]|uniref:Uncharacterized protein n=1 Tax=Gossypium schwendimanii TaxID=34291 RepID=A0A7J9KZF1_GOSSC|nr:hypothetical protein [Gossypium schwendimanii]